MINVVSNVADEGHYFTMDDAPIGVPLRVVEGSYENLSVCKRNPLTREGDIVVVLKDIDRGKLLWIFDQDRGNTYCPAHAILLAYPEDDVVITIEKERDGKEDEDIHIPF